MSQYLHKNQIQKNCHFVMHSNIVYVDIHVEISPNVIMLLEA